MFRKAKSKWCFMLLAAALIVPSSMITAPHTADAAASEAYQWKSVVTGGGGGFVPGIIFNETEPDLIYARTDIGGAYRWNPADSSWIPLTDSVGYEDWNKNGVDALATDPVDPNRVYMATGTYTNDWDPHNGQIMRSADRGDTWQVTPLPFKVGGNMPGRSMGERLAIDPNRNNILYFGARSGNGLWKSSDYGATWAKVTSFPNPGTYAEVPGDSYQGDILGLSWITFDKSTGTAGQATQTIYAGVGDKSNNLFKSTNGGATWTAIPGQPSGYIPHHGVLSANGNLYISYIDGSGPYRGEEGEVWKLNTSTGVWTNVSPIPVSSPDNHFGYGGLAVDAQHPDTLVVATLNAWWPDEQLFRSTDGGATWSRIWDFDGYPTRKLRYTLDISAAPWLDFEAQPVAPEMTPKLGWMIGDLEIDPFNSDRMMYGTGATIYGTNNLTDWDTASGKVNLSVMAKGLEETAVLDLISPPAGPPLISALADVSGFRHTNLDVPPAKMHNNPISSASMDYAELDPGFIVRAGFVDKNNPTAKFFSLSHDSAANWYTANGSPSTVNGGGTVALAADGSSIVWSLPDSGVYYSKTGGNSWTASTGLPLQAEVASDRANKNKFYGFSAGTFYLSTDGGATFAATAATGLPLKGSVNFKAMPGREGDIWLAGGSDEAGQLYGMWHSTDSGASFTKLSNVEQANVVGFGKAAPGKSYMAIYTTARIDGVRGVFRSNDAGASWLRINDDQHQYASINSAITGDPKVYGRVYLGTNGRGIMYGDSLGTPPESNDSTIIPSSASFDKKTANQADIAVTLTLNGNTLAGIKNGADTLVEGTDYTVSGSTVTLLSSYLAARPVGTTNLSFTFSAGAAASLVIGIVDTTSSANDSTITPSSASFDKKTVNQADIAVTLTLNGNTLAGIKNGADTLVEGTDYTVSGSTVTLLSSYLAARPVGTTNLSFTFSAGAAASLVIGIVDTTAAVPGSIKVQMYNGAIAATANTLNPRIKLTNTGSTAVNLADVTIRYYYTINGEKAQTVFFDWSTVGSANVTGTFVKLDTPTSTADTYASIGFTSAAGSLAAGQSIEIQTRIAKTDWSNYTQTDDYSFNSTATQYTDRPEAPAYVSGSLQWGVEPQ
ncbi:X2-like carbohydrate binding domain-containing protein [Paenibacillus donghaensis]|uniref:Xyloglucanase n=1 Tax=Paenibacillus donghaensis TaxID=414771 RepID=A0A2Z2KH90_9BACL|nr:X2-like carbohydrate binding domain-containing protein [Paenibacillus donghaensis]ASA22540.1 xyloglucanase [Paenibacillus donghaensis]